MPTISAGSENGMIITRCDSGYSVSLWPNQTLQNACVKLGQIHLLHWGPMLTRYENRFVVGSWLFWRVDQIYICRLSRWVRKCHDHGSGRTAWFWRERYVDLLRCCNGKSHNWIVALPQFLADEKERATTRYVNITTIATFFSSVAATTLQMSISDSPSGLLNIVNFFWFLSLVFSVSSGVSSLLGMTWRKSSMWAVYCS